MSRTLSLLSAVAALLTLSAATATAATFTGTTSEGSSITFEATGDQVSGVVSQLPMVCTNRAGIEPFQPSGAFTANGAESTLTELRPSAVLNRDATMNYAFTGTVAGEQASGTIALNYATTDFDLLTMTTTITVCAGSADFSATAPKAADPPKADDPPAKQPGKKQKKKKKKRKRGKQGRRA